MIDLIEKHKIHNFIVYVDKKFDCKWLHKASLFKGYLNQAVQKLIAIILYKPFRNK